MELSRAVNVVAVPAVLILLLGGCSSGGGGPKPYLLEGSVSTLSATVESINPATRHVTLQKDSGNSVTFAVDPRVRNLDKVKVGDRVKAAYVESVEVHVRDPGAAGKEDAATAADTAEWEESSEGLFMRQSTVTVVVKKVDRKKGTVALRSPEGEVYPFRVRDRRNLENVNVGDEVVATHREALAVAIDPVER